MPCAEFATNRDANEQQMIPPAMLFGSNTQTSNVLSVRASATASKVIMSPESFIGLELRLVPEVEEVYVDRVGTGKELRVMIVVNDRDPELRAKIYAREQAIIDYLTNLDFDFHIVARMNRDLRDVVNGVGKLAYKKR